MKNKKTYSAPAILEEVILEMEERILYESRPVTDTDFQEVETMGQTVDNNISFEHEW